MDSDIQEALELANEKRQFHMERNKARQSRRSDCDHETWSSTSRPFNSSSPLDPLFAPPLPCYLPSSLDLLLALFSDDSTGHAWSIDGNEPDEEFDAIGAHESSIDRIDDLPVFKSSAHSDEINGAEDSSTTDEPLHAYANITTGSFASRLVYLFRQSRLSKTQFGRFIDLIHSALPISLDM